MSNPSWFQQPEEPTCFSGYLNEGIHAALAVVALRCQRGDVVPPHGLDYVQHGLGLVGVGGHHTGEELVAAVVAQLRGGGGVADLGDLRHTDGSAVSKGVRSGRKCEQLQLLGQ